MQVAISFDGMTPLPVVYFLLVALFVLVLAAVVNGLDHDHCQHRCRDRCFPLHHHYGL